MTLSGERRWKNAKAHPQRALVGLNLAGGVVPSTGDGVYIGRAQIGQVTSAMRSPALGKIIALARLDTTHNKAETAVKSENLTASKNGYRQRYALSRILIRPRSASKAITSLCLVSEKDCRGRILGLPIGMEA